MGHVLHQAYGRLLIGRDPRSTRRSGSTCGARTGTVQPTSTLLGTIDIALWDIRGKAVGRPIARLLGLARERVPRLRHGDHRRPDARTGLRGGETPRSGGLSRLQDPVLGRPGRATSRGSAPRAKRSAPTSRCSRTRPGSTRGPRRWAPATCSRRSTTAGSRSRCPTGRSTSSSASPTSSDVPVLATETLRLHELPENLRHRRRRHRPRRRPHQGRHHRPAQGVHRGRTVRLQPGDPRTRAASSRRGEPPRRAVDRELRVLRGHQAIYEGLVGSPLAIDADGCRHLPDAPGLGVEMDWDWVDDHTEEVIRSGDDARRDGGRPTPGRGRRARPLPRHRLGRHAAPVPRATWRSSRCSTRTRRTGRRSAALLDPSLSAALTRVPRPALQTDLDRPSRASPEVALVTMPDGCPAVIERLARGGVHSSSTSPRRCGRGCAAGVRGRAGHGVRIVVGLTRRYSPAARAARASCDRPAGARHRGGRCSRRRRSRPRAGEPPVLGRAQRGRHPRVAGDPRSGTLPWLVGEPVVEVSAMTARRAIRTSRWKTWRRSPCASPGGPGDPPGRVCAARPRLSGSFAIRGRRASLELGAGRGADARDGRRRRS